jgi:hypothetical protein
MDNEQWRDRPARREVRKGLLVGFLGGLVACWAMNQWLALWQRLVEGDTAPHRGQPVAGHGGQLARAGPDARQPPTMHAAAALADGLFRHAPTERGRQRLGQTLHYTFGAATGALYGTRADALPALTMAGGVPFGLAGWLLADALALPALAAGAPGWSPLQSCSCWPTATPSSIWWAIHPWMCRGCAPGKAREAGPTARFPNAPGGWKTGFI